MTPHRVLWTVLYVLPQTSQTGFISIPFQTGNSCKPNQAGGLQGEEEINKLAERMQNLLRPFVLRRLKTEVASQLAPKKHQLHKLPMTEEQSQLYAKAVAALRKDLTPEAGRENPPFSPPTQ